MSWGNNVKNTPTKEEETEREKKPNQRDIGSWQREEYNGGAFQWKEKESLKNMHITYTVKEEEEEKEEGENINYYIETAMIR